MSKPPNYMKWCNWSRFLIYFTSHKRLQWQALFFIGGNPHSLKIPLKLKGNFCTVKWQLVLWDFTLLLVLRDGPGNECCMSESNLSLKWHTVALTGSVIWLSVTGLLRKLSCDFPCFLAIWNLTVNLLTYFPYTTFIWSLWAVDCISFRLASLEINKLTEVFSRAFPPAAVLLFSESWAYHETIQPFPLRDCSEAVSGVTTFSTY